MGEYIPGQSADLKRLAAAEPVYDPYPVLAGIDDTLFAQDGQVLRQVGLGDAEQRLDLADAAFTLRQRLDNRQTYWVRKGFEDIGFPRQSICHFNHRPQ